MQRYLLVRSNRFNAAVKVARGQANTHKDNILAKIIDYHEKNGTKITVIIEIGG